MTLPPGCKGQRHWSAIRMTITREFAEDIAADVASERDHPGP